MLHKNVNCLQIILSYELPKIDYWLKSNQLSLNMNKTNYLFFNKTKQNINHQINNRPISHAACVKYLDVYLDEKVCWNRHIEHIDIKFSDAKGTLYKLNKYIPKSAVMAVCYSLVYSHLQYAIICCGNTSKNKIRKLEVKQNKIVKIWQKSDFEKRFGKKVRLKPLFNKLQVLNINGIDKLEVAKLMAKISSNNLPVFSTEHIVNFPKRSSIHAYSTRSARSIKFF